MTSRTSTSELLDREPPHDDEAENVVNGSIMLRAEVVDDVAEIVSPHDFYQERARLLFEVLCDIHARGLRADDLVLINHELKTAGVLEQIGGRTYLCSVQASAPTAAHAMHYANIVRKLSRVRATRQALTIGLRNASAGSADPDQIIAALQAELSDIADGGSRRPPVDAATAAGHAVERARLVLTRGFRWVCSPA